MRDHQDRATISFHCVKSVMAASARPPPNTVWFYHASEVPFGCFSNFSLHPVVLGGRTWATSEHYFQAMKFFPHSPADVDAVANCHHAGEAAKMGRERHRPLRKDWEAVKDQTMFDVVLAKFSQHPDIGGVLLMTHGDTIVERTRNDAYWGDGGDGSGRNMLGITLMRVRDELRRRLAAAEAAT